MYSDLDKLRLNILEIVNLNIDSSLDYISKLLVEIILNYLKIRDTRIDRNC